MANMVTSNEEDMVIRQNAKIAIPPELTKEDGTARVVWMDVETSYDELRTMLELEARSRGFKGRNIDTLFIQRSPNRGHPIRISMVVE